MSVVADACYTIRFGGFSFDGTPGSADQGESELEIGVVCIPFSPPIQAPPPHDVRKNRYISFVPNNSESKVAFRIDPTPVQILDHCWVDAPDSLGNAKCGFWPLYQIWNEPVIHVGDCEIRPVKNYQVVSVAQDPSSAGVTHPFVLPVGTIELPSLNEKFWGDVCGSNNGVEWTPPNLFTNVNDILAVLAYISNATIKPTFQMVNLQATSAADPCLNAFVNTADVLILVKAVAGEAYPFTTNPANCPVCP